MPLYFKGLKEEKVSKVKTIF